MKSRSHHKQKKILKFFFKKNKCGFNTLFSHILVDLRVMVTKQSYIED